MGDYRSKPHGDDGKMRRESYYGHNKPSSKPNHFRSQTFSYDSSSSSAYACGGLPQVQPNESSFGHKPNSNVPNHVIRSQSVSYDFCHAYGLPAQQSNESYYGYTKKPSIHSRSQSVSSSYDNSSYYAYGGSPQQKQIVAVKDLKFKKSKSTSASTSSVISKSSWGLSDPELQRKKRVASYKVYSVEGKVKGSLKKSFKWVKDRYTQVVNGWS
ncbi:hypothetical protein Vadar_000248 [Vaccinium darrowii]|uniref:Uncharacterized protein n=1 Tax=Vaccinium darrowii TaxID=229202 RepID=A0ACB7Z871_9ERIC|nr:hypothetical protein Vadar_000248 [Vaccinium darrowii]